MCSEPKKLKGFLTDLQIYLHPAALSQSRRRIFERQIPQNGGTMVQELKTCKCKTIVLIDDQMVAKDKLQYVIDKCMDSSENPDTINFVALKWLSDCLKESDALDFGPYMLRQNSKGEVAKTDDNVGCSSLDASHGKQQPSLQQKFVCAHSSEDPSQPKNHNKQITDELEKLAKAYKNSNDVWRSFGYEKAIAAIKRYPKPIENGCEVAAVKGVGAKMASKIEEILSSGKLQKVHEVCDDEKAQTLQLFNRIWGAGPTTAEMWFQQGFRTLEDLREKAKLTKQQMVGLRLFDDLDERMPRSEAFEIESIVKNHAHRINSELEVIACGSYRRGKPTCGDLDVLVTHRTMVDGVFEKILDSMRQSKFLTDDLTIQSHGRQKKYLGVCKIPNGKHRRLDIIVVPNEEKATALMYFTGSAHFNRSMRLLAIKMGMSLSEHSLRRDIVRQGKEKMNHGTVLPTPTEKSIFEHLGLKYRPPNERDH